MEPKAHSAIKQEIPLVSRVIFLCFHTEAEVTIIRSSWMVLEFEVEAFRLDWTLVIYTGFRLDIPF